MTNERLQKVLRDAGFGSRRHCETLIESGAVVINGRMVTEMGVQVDPTSDDIRVDGRRVKRQPLRYIMVNKPKGFACTNNPEEGHKRVVDIVPEADVLLHTVGRLDVDSEGLVLLTNDGDLTAILTHPRYGIEKTYRVTVRGELDDESLDKLRHTTHLAEGPAQPDRATLVFRDRQHTVLEVVLTEGRNREIRRILARLDFKVKKLKRVAFGPLSVRGLGTGQARPLKRSEIKQLKDLAARATRPRRRPKRKGPKT
jgi:23S rRNA pseudouridine2605 synthase